MKMIKTVMLALAIVAGADLMCRATTTTNGKDARNELEEINSTLEKFYVTENVTALTGIYAKEFTFFPEYKPAIFEIQKLDKFFSDWFAKSDINSYKKAIYLVEAYSPYLLEIGTFTLRYSSSSDPSGNYNGKYMTLWRKDAKGNLKIVSETFGANEQIEPEDMPYEHVQVEESVSKMTSKLDRKLLAEVEAFDAVVLKAVAEGNGIARAEGFTPDAVLLSNFDSIKVGMDHIRPKMLKTYTSAVSFNVQHNYNVIYDLGDYVFVNGQYKGGWGDSTNGGTFGGNMSNLLKRIDGKLLMHRQAGNRDSKLMVFGN